ncbi:MAG: hypothetical protein ACOYN0_11295 [Phycisphaerales bacterium]
MKLQASLIGAGLALAATGTAANAQLSITSWTVNGGGGTVVNGPFRLSGTAGQADATAPVQFGPNTLIGGYWGASTACPACAADYNKDGGIDGDDVIAFFGDWDSAAGCSDVTRDGGIDGDDVIQFFSQWDVGGC